MIDFFLLYIPAFLLAIFILVSVHEYGHFWVARKLGIKVLRFSIGFGRVLWRKTGADGTEYVLSAIPLGGYVKMLDGREDDLDPAEAHRAFNNKPVLSRIAVLVAGPGFNFAFAIFACWLMFVLGIPGVKPILGDIQTDSPAARAGLQAEDRILRVGDRDVETWDGAYLELLNELLDDGRIPLLVESPDGRQKRAEIVVEGNLAKLTEPNALFPGLGVSAFRPDWPAAIGEMAPGLAADKSGLESGDLVVSADGVAIEGWRQWVDFVRARPDQTVNIEVDRGGSRILLDLNIGNKVTDDGSRVGLIGAGPQQPDFSEYRAMRRFGLIEAVPASVEEVWRLGKTTVTMFGKMLTGQVSIKNLTGPVRIAEFAGVAAKDGIESFLRFLAYVSLSLGILNLLPIPLLDGGQVVYQVAEAVKGSALSPRTEQLGQMVGIAMLITLMGFAFYNDITHTICRQFPICG